MQAFYLLLFSSLFRINFVFKDVAKKLTQKRCEAGDFDMPKIKKRQHKSSKGNKIKAPQF